MNLGSVPARGSLLWRGVMSSFVLVGTSGLCLLVFFLFNQRQAMVQQLELRAKSIAGFLGKQCGFPALVGNTDELNRIAQSAIRDEDVLYVAVLDRGGAVVARASRDKNHAPDEGVLEASSAIVAGADASFVDWKAEGQATPLGTVRVGVSRDKLIGAYRRTVKTTFSICVLGFLLVVLVWFLQLSRMLRPLKDLIAFTHRVAEGDLSPCEGIEGTNEFAELTTSFNSMVRQLDVSRQELLVRVEEAQQANRLKSEFLANVSHELRTPLNGIIGMAELLSDTSLTPAQLSDLSTLKSSAHSLLHVISDILDLSRVEAGKMNFIAVPFELPELIAMTLNPLLHRARQKKLDLSWEIAKGMDSGWVGDPLRIRQVLSNLVDNAIKFTPAGHVSVSVARESEEGLTTLHVVVQDTGTGIPADKLEFVFEPFAQLDGSRTRQQGGTGLGLTICARLVAAMGGRIWIESQPGTGSRFHFTVRLEPLPPPAANPIRLKSIPVEEGAVENAAASAGEHTLEQISILVAEDNPVNQAIAVRLLERRGHKVKVARNGRDAVLACEEQTFDAVLMDIQMPEMDGYEATAEIRSREKSKGTRVQIIAVTAHAMDGDRERCLRAGMDGYLAKPITPDRLYAAINCVNRA